LLSRNRKPLAAWTCQLVSDNKLCRGGAVCALRYLAPADLVHEESPMSGTAFSFTENIASQIISSGHDSGFILQLLQLL
jgi:hypothetical protein